MEHSHYLYAGEFYLSDESKLRSEEKFEVIVGSKTKKIERQDIKHVKQADGTIHISFSGTKIVEEEVPEVEYVDCYIPVAEYSLESENSAIPGAHANILTRMIFEKLELVYDPTSLEYRDSNGALAAKNISYEGAASSNSRRLFYIRKDLIVKFLDDEELKLVWCAKGERRLAKMESFHAPSDGTARYVNFNFCRLFDE